MPFTFSHPAIVLPLACLPKRWFSLTGLVIGSLTPDFEYFLRMEIRSDFSHSVSGLFWFDVPLGLLLAFLFHNVVRDSLFNNLPGFLRMRFATFLEFNWNKYFKQNGLVVLISLIIGAASHIFWDGFTHSYGYFAEIIPALTGKVMLLGKQVPIFKILQHSSTLVGGGIIAGVVWRLPRTAVENPEIAPFKYWLLVSGILLAVIALKLFTGLEAVQIGNVVVTVIAAALLSLILTPLILNASRT